MKYMNVSLKILLAPIAKVASNLKHLETSNVAPFHRRDLYISVDYILEGIRWGEAKNQTSMGTPVDT